MHNYNLRNQGWPRTFTCVRSSSDRGEEADPVPYTKEVVNFYPSNADIVYAAKATTAKRHSAIGAYSPPELKKGVFGNTPAGKGHYILPAFDRNRTSISGIPGLYDITRDKDRYRPTSVEFFSGRVFFLMPDGKILFSQTIEDRDFRTAEQCYQEADPTAEDINELVATDGGTLVVQEIGEAIDLRSTGSELLLFADNGVWGISGSEQSNFKATDFLVRRITNIGVTGLDTIVTAENNVIYWGQGGIYILAPNEVTGDLQAQNISEQTIQTFYNNILPASRANAKGFYDERERKVMWMYNDTDVYNGITFKNRYNRILFFDVVLGAFYTYTVELQDSIPYMTSLLQKEASGNKVAPKDVIIELLPGSFKTNWTTDSSDQSITLPLHEDGAYSFSVHWGDGTFDLINAWDDPNKTHTYSTAGTYTVSIGGTHTKWDSTTISSTIRDRFVSVEQWGDIAWGSDLTNFMWSCQNMVINATDQPNLSAVDSLNAAWGNCKSLTTFPVFDVSNVTDFSSTWTGCDGLTSFPEGLDFSNGTLFVGTWSNCTGLTSFPSTFDFSNGTSFASTWAGCSSLTSFPTYSFPNALSLRSTWLGTTFTSISVSGTSNVTDWRETFAFNSDLLTIAPLDMQSATETYEPNFAGTIFGAGQHMVGGCFNLQSLACNGLTAKGLSVTNCDFDESGLNALMSSLGTHDPGETNNNLLIAFNPGTGAADQSIATAKNWDVDTSNT